jgi:tRNA(Ile)-lysidine synthase
MHGESGSNEKSFKFTVVMLLSILNYIDEHSLFSREDKILVGVSGGIDSVVLFDLLVRAGYEVAIAHCNFQLRGEESDQDQRFVNWLAEQHDVPFFVKKFDTLQYASEYGISIQMAARKLRFDWFEKLIQGENYDCIAIGHNKNDSVETALINLARGTGLKGITGIKPGDNKIVRPLLFAKRSEIIRYCAEYGLNYREDSSNQTTKYSRNRIRHKIIPEFEKINPQFLDTMNDNINHFSSAYRLFESFISEIKTKVLKQEGERWELSINSLDEYPEKHTLLFELLRPFRFTAEVVSDIFFSLDSESGKIFYSDEYKAVKDRNKLIITAFQDSRPNRFYIEKDVEQVVEPLNLIMQVQDIDSSFHIPAKPNVACIDYDQIDFPLILRKWQSGDYFKPLGFGHYKKLSDFFIDNKYSLVDKENTWILTTGEQIVWIVGARLDDRFKITKHTERILRIDYTP